MIRAVRCRGFWSRAVGALLARGMPLGALLAFASPAFAAEPPLCTDRSILFHIKQAYEAHLMLDTSGRKFRGAEDVRETGYSPHPREVNQYTPSNDDYNKSRYCEARIRLDNGETDTAYVRIDGLKDGPANDFNFDPCFLKYNTLQDGCVDQRSGRR